MDIIFKIVFWTSFSTGRMLKLTFLPTMQFEISLLSIISHQVWVNHKPSRPKSKKKEHNQNINFRSNGCLASSHKPKNWVLINLGCKGCVFFIQNDPLKFAPNEWWYFDLYHDILNQSNLHRNRLYEYPRGS